MTDLADSSEKIEAMAQQLKVLANPKRLQIINLLMEGVQCNCELADALNLPLNLISHHMAILRKAGLVNVQRDVSDSRWVYFSINKPHLRSLIQAIGTFFDIAKGINADVVIEGSSLRIETKTVILFIEPECKHMKDVNKRTFKIIK